LHPPLGDKHFNQPAFCNDPDWWRSPFSFMRVRASEDGNLGRRDDVLAVGGTVERAAREEPDGYC
jgi:hypothetical protein